MIITTEKYKDTYIVYIDENEKARDMRIHSAMDEWYTTYPALSTDCTLGALLDRILPVRRGT